MKTRKALVIRKKDLTQGVLRQIIKAETVLEAIIVVVERNKRLLMVPTIKVVKTLASTYV